MTSERWQCLQGLFESVMQSPASERPHRLREIAESLDDDALLLELQRLVEHAEPESAFLQPVQATALLDWVTGKGIRPGDVLADRFEIVRPIGRGGMGEVFEALDRVLQERVAVKTIGTVAAAPGGLERFQREVRVARRISHPGVCRIHDFGEHQGTPFLTMELVSGETLSARLARGPLTLEEWEAAARQIFKAIAAAHAAGVIHRDLKPSNIMIDGPRFVILDFGLASPVAPADGDELTHTGMLLGTLDWMAPEQLHGASDARTDIYSAALILLTALQGRPLEANPRGLTGALRRATGESDFRKCLPKSLSRRQRYVLRRCLEREPEKRFQTAAETLAFLSGETAATARAARRWFWGKPALALGFLVLAVSLFATVARFVKYPGLKPGSRILVAETLNATGESRFDGMTTVLRASLAQSSKYNIWDSQRLGTMLREMRRDPGRRPDARVWREIAFREDVPFVVFSTLSPSGDGYSLTLHCEQIGRDPNSAARSWDDSVRAAGPDGLFEAVRDAAAWVRKTAGEQAEDLSSHNRLPQEITSSSWEALELYERAQELSASGRPAEAIPALQRSVELDPAFAMGFMRLGDILNSQRQNEQGFSSWRKAISLARSQHLSEHERLSIESRYAIETGDFPGAEPILRQWASEFPNDPLAQELLASCLLDLGRYPEAIELARRAQASFRPTVFGVGVWIRGLAAAGRVKEMPEPLSLMERLSPTWALQLRGVAAAIQEDYPGAEREFRALTSASQDPQMVSRAVALRSILAADRGDLDGAAQLLREGIEQDRRLGQEGFASQKAAGLAFVEGLRGDRMSARVWALEAVSAASSPETLMLAASALARLGFVADAVQLEARFPAWEGPIFESARLRIRGELLAAEGNHQKAVAILEHAARLASAQDPREYLAHALDLAGQPQRARLIYEAIVNTPWRIWHAPEYEWPGIRFVAKTYIQSRKGN